MNYCIFKLDKDASIMYHGIIQKEDIMSEEDYKNLLSYYFFMKHESGAEVDTLATPTIAMMLNTIGVTSFSIGNETVYELPMEVGNDEIGHRRYVKLDKHGHIRNLNDTQFREVDYRTTLQGEGQAKQVFIPSLNTFIKCFKSSKNDKIWALDMEDQATLDKVSQEELKESFNSDKSYGISLNRTQEIFDSLEIKQGKNTAKKVLNTISTMREQFQMDSDRQIIKGVYINKIEVDDTASGNPKIKISVGHGKIGKYDAGTWNISMSLNDDKESVTIADNIKKTIAIYASLQKPNSTNSATVSTQSTTSSGKDISKADYSKLKSTIDLITPNNYWYDSETETFCFVVPNDFKGAQDAPLHLYAVTKSGYINRRGVNEGKVLKNTQPVKEGSNEYNDILKLKQEVLESVSPDVASTNTTNNSSNTVQGENISSSGSELAKKLTNPGNNLEVVYKGVKFRNAEHAYQTWKSGEFDQAAYESTAFKPKGSKPVNKNSSFNTMVEILTEKFKQHPELIKETESRGGLAFIKASTHEVVGDQFWEKEGNFIKALYQAAKNAGMKDSSTSSSTVEEHKGYWTRNEVEKNQDKVYLFGDNTDDRVNTKYVPSSTQAVIRGLPNAISIDTKKNRGTNADSYFTDADYEVFKQQVDDAINQAKSSGKTIVLPEDGIGTGKADLQRKAPKCYQYLQEQLFRLKNNIQTKESIADIDSHFEADSKWGYQSRTTANTNWSTTTIGIAVDYTTGGEKLTKKSAGDKYVSLEGHGFHIDDPEGDAQFIFDHWKGPKDNVKLNVTGNGIYHFSSSQQELNQYMIGFLKKLRDDLKISFEEVRSGGQTGMDEAGVMAAKSLGIPWKVHAPGDWRFKTKEGDQGNIKDEVLFKTRFLDKGVDVINYKTESVGNLEELLPILSKKAVDVVKAVEQVKSTQEEDTKEINNLLFNDDNDDVLIDTKVGKVCLTKSKRIYLIKGENKELVTPVHKDYSTIEQAVRSYLESSRNDKDITESLDFNNNFDNPNLKSVFQITDDTRMEAVLDLWLSGEKDELTGLYPAEFFQTQRAYIVDLLNSGRLFNGKDGNNFDVTNSLLKIMDKVDTTLSKAIQKKAIEFKNTLGDISVEEYDGNFLKSNQQVQVAVLKDKEQQRKKELLESDKGSQYIDYSNIDEISDANKMINAAFRADAINLVTARFIKVVDRLVKEELEKFDAIAEENKNSTTLSEQEKEERLARIKAQKEELTRQDVIMRVGIPKIIEEIQIQLARRIASFQKALKATDDEALKAKYRNSISELAKFVILKKDKIQDTDTDPFVREAKQKVIDKKTLLLKVIFSEAVPNLRLLENLTFNLESTKRNVSESDTDYENNAIATLSKEDSMGADTDPMQEVYDGEKVRDNTWDIDVMTVSGHASLSAEVKKAFMNISMLDNNGNKIGTVYGDPKVFESTYVHAVLLKALKGMTRPEEMIPMLEEAAIKIPWIRQVIDLLKPNSQPIDTGEVDANGAPVLESRDVNESFRSMFYKDMRKDMQSYFVQRIAFNNKGERIAKTVQINSVEGSSTLMSEWAFSLSNFEQLGIRKASNGREDNFTIYNEDGTKNKVGLNNLATLITSIRKKVEENKQHLDNIVHSDEFRDSIKFALNSVGCSIDDQLLALAIETSATHKQQRLADKQNSDPTDVDDDDDSEKESKKPEEDPRLETLNTILDALANMQSVVAKGNVVATDDGFYDYFQSLKSQYYTLAKVLGEVAESEQEASVNERGKSFYAHIMSSYGGKMITRLSEMDDEKIRQFIEEEFGYDSFMKNQTTGEYENEWLNSIIPEALLEIPANASESERASIAAKNDEILRKNEVKKKIRSKFSKHIVLHRDGVEYNDWDMAQYASVMLDEYEGAVDIIKDGKEEIQFANFAVPIMADSPCAEFIKFRKYTITADKTVQEQMLPLYRKLINQEYLRIRRTRDKIERVRRGELGPETLIDTIESGKNTRGLEFCFFPKLNTYVVHSSNTAIDGKNFLEALDYLAANKSVTNDNEMNSLIDQAMVDILDEDFTEAVDTWSDIGLFRTNEDGNLTLLSNNMVKSEDVKAIKGYAETLKSIKKVLGNAWTIDMQKLLDQYSTGLSYKHEWEQSVLNQMQPLVMSSNAEISIKDKFNHIAPKEMLQGLKDYFWNSQYASSQIIQIMTTDLAFYKDATDFQKRFKEIHAPGLRLNTLSKYGTKYEKTIYLKDEELVSNRADIIKAIFMERYNNNEISAALCCQALSSYGIHTDYDSKGNPITTVGNITMKTKEVNIADAQAYRSMEGMRSILDMMGKWSPQMQKAFENLSKADYKLTEDDFNIFWNTVKPFFFGNNKYSYDDGKGGSVNMRVCSQHKNSEFALTVIMAAAARQADFRHSAKLKGLNKFMSKYNIHLAQFESAVKAGGQGKIDISHDPSKIDKLNRTYEEAKEYWLNEVAQGRETSETIRQKDKLGAFDWDNEDALVEYLERKAFLKDPNTGQLVENNAVIHSVNYEDYGIQINTEEHFLDKEQLIGTQIRKLIFSDIAETSTFQVPTGKVDKQGNPLYKNYSKKELLQLYNEIITENILDSFEELRKIFKNDRELELVLRTECQSDARYSLDALLACALNSDGKFNLPLFDPSQGTKIQNILNSIIKKRVTNQKMRGGTLIQLSSFGMDNDLNLIYKNEKGEEITYDYFLKNIYKGSLNTDQDKEIARKDYTSWALKEKEAGRLSVAAYEVYMPAYSKKFFEPLMDENGNLDINKLPKELRECIGYRVPTEAHYSMAPLRIKGFMPQQNGGVIMLPADITVISGSDFDVDKLYIMFPEFAVDEHIRWDEVEASVYKELERLVENQYALHNNSDILIQNIAKISQIKNDLNTAVHFLKNQVEDGKPFLKSTSEDLEFMSDEAKQVWDIFQNSWKNIKKGHFSTSVRKVKYNYNKEAYENSKFARNNAMLDIWRAVLTNKDVADKALTPGNFDEQKKVARIMDFLNSKKSIDEKNKILEDLKIKNSNGAILTMHSKNLLDELNGKTLDVLSKLAKQVATQHQPLSPTTQTYFHQQNATGGKMIGVYANHNANHALIQLLDNDVFDGLTLGKANQFTLFGHTYNNISRQYKIDVEGKKIYISKTSAGFLAASVDNVKDPVLASLNQNKFTADASMLLARLGYSTLEIGLIMNHPVVRQMTKDYFAETNYMTNSQFALEWCKKFYKDFQVSIESAMDIAQHNDITHQELMNDIIEGNTDNAKVAQLFIHLLKVGENLGTLVAGMRSDTGKGAAGPTIADNVITNQKVQNAQLDFRNNLLWKLTLKPGQKEPEWMKRDKFGNLMPELFPEITADMSREQMRQVCKESLFPYMTAFYNAGMKTTEELFRPYMIQCSPQMKLIIGRLTELSYKTKLSVDTLKSIFNEFIAVQLLKTKTFRDDNPSEENSKSAFDKRDYIINEFPKAFYHFKKQYENAKESPVILSNTFLQRLICRKNTNNKKAETEYDLIFRDPGKATPYQEQLLKNDWIALLTDDNTYSWGGKNSKERITGSQIGLYLYMYSFYKGGLAFGSQSFGHLTSTLLKLNIDDYRDVLYKALEDCQNTDDPDQFEWFVQSWIHRHPENNQLVPKFTDDNIVKGCTKVKNNKKTPKTLVNLPIQDKFGNPTSIVKQVDPMLGVIYQTHFKVEIDGKVAYYRLRKQASNRTKKALYVRWFPSSKDFLEYEYGKLPWDTNSVIPKTVIKNIKEEANKVDNAKYDDSAEDDTGTIYELSDQGKAQQTAQNMTPIDSFNSEISKDLCGFNLNF